MVHRAKFLLQHHSNPSLDNIITSDIEDFLTRALVCLPRSPMVPDISDFLLDQDLQTTYDIEEHKRSQFEWVRPSTKEKHNLPTWLRYAITEILFEARGIYCDSAYTSITNCILSARKAAGLDLHGALDHLCITGGLCQIPGLQKRIQAETGLKILDNPFASDLAWTGASLATSMKVEGQTLNIHTFTGSSKMPDWSQRPR